MIIKFLAQARAELTDAVAYYEGELSGLGYRLWEEVDEHVSWIERNHDYYRSVGYPFVDIFNGGTLDGLLVAQGWTVEQVLASHLTADTEASISQETQTAEQFVRWMYAELKRSQQDERGLAADIAFVGHLAVAMTEVLSERE